MQVNHTIQLTTAVAGSGKSYVRCACFIAEHFLPNEAGRIWSNYPINIEAMVEYCRKWYRLDPDATRARIRVFPKKVMKAWVEGSSGPWHFFGTCSPVELTSYMNDDLWVGHYYPDEIREQEQGEADERRTVLGVSISGDHIAIDEAHRVIGLFTHKQTGERQKTVNLKNWQEFLGEMRHRGARIEFVTQSPRKLHPIVHNESGVRCTLVNTDNERDPIFGILNSDWRNLIASITRVYEPVIQETEFIDYDGKERINSERRWKLEPKRFPLYSSYSAPESGGMAAESTHVLKEYQKHTPWGLWWWFLKRNLFAMAPKIMLVLLGIYLFFFGGFALVTAKAMGVFMNVGRKDAPPVGGVVASPSITESVIEEQTSSEVYSSLTGSVISSNQPEVLYYDSVIETSATSVDFPPVCYVDSSTVVFNDGTLLKLGDSYSTYTLQDISYESRKIIFSDSLIINF